MRPRQRTISALGLRAVNEMKDHAAPGQGQSRRGLWRRRPTLWAWLTLDTWRASRIGRKLDLPLACAGAIGIRPLNHGAEGTLDSDVWLDVDLAPASPEAPAAPALAPCAIVAPPRSSTKTGSIANTRPPLDWPFSSRFKLSNEIRSNQFLRVRRPWAAATPRGRHCRRARCGMDFTDLNCAMPPGMGPDKHDGGDARDCLRDTKAELKQDCAGGQAGATCSVAATE
jgi:hypothetical protein